MGDRHSKHEKKDPVQLQSGPVWSRVCRISVLWLRSRVIYVGFCIPLYGGSERFGAHLRHAAVLKGTIRTLLCGRANSHARS
ncbi:hypothetical protein ACU8KH_05833 [Lachancea thermotolerans]